MAPGGKLLKQGPPSYHLEDQSRYPGQTLPPRRGDVRLVRTPGGGLETRTSVAPPLPSELSGVPEFNQLRGPIPIAADTNTPPAEVVFQRLDEQKRRLLAQREPLRKLALEGYNALNHWPGVPGWDHPNPRGLSADEGYQQMKAAEEQMRPLDRELNIVNGELLRVRRRVRLERDMSRTPLANLPPDVRNLINDIRNANVHDSSSQVEGYREMMAKYNPNFRP